MEELIYELDMKFALNALTSSCLFEFRAFYLSIFFTTSVIIFLSLLSSAKKYQKIITAPVIIFLSLFKQCKEIPELTYQLQSYKISNVAL